MTRRIAITAWHLAAPLENRWHEWHDADFSLRACSEVGVFCGGMSLETGAPAACLSKLPRGPQNG